MKELSLEEEAAQESWVPDSPIFEIAAEKQDFVSRQHEQLRERHLRNAAFALERLIDNAGYALRTLERHELLPGDHLETYVYSYERAIAALDALKEHEETEGK